MLLQKLPLDLFRRSVYNGAPIRVLDPKAHLLSDYISKVVREVVGWVAEGRAHCLAVVVLNEGGVSRGLLQLSAILVFGSENPRTILL